MHFPGSAPGERERERERERQTDRQTDRPTDRPTDIDIKREGKRQSERDEQRDRNTCREYRTYNLIVFGGKGSGDTVFTFLFFSLPGEDVPFLVQHVLC